MALLFHGEPFLSYPMSSTRGVLDVRLFFGWCVCLVLALNVSPNDLAAFLQARCSASFFELPRPCPASLSPMLTTA